MSDRFPDAVLLVDSLDDPLTAISRTFEGEWALDQKRAPKGLAKVIDSIGYKRFITNDTFVGVSDDGHMFDKTDVQHILNGEKPEHQVSDEKHSVNVFHGSRFSVWYQAPRLSVSSVPEQIVKFVLSQLDQQSAVGLELFSPGEDFKNMEAESDFVSGFLKYSAIPEKPDTFKVHWAFDHRSREFMTASDFVQVSLFCSYFLLGIQLC